MVPDNLELLAVLLTLEPLKLPVAALDKVQKLGVEVMAILAAQLVT
jgi:hypothetical protein